MKQRNPFPVSDYVSPEYFCDREQETGSLLSAIDSNRNVAIISNRRIGKTALIKHVRGKILQRKSHKFLYVDIMPTSDFSDFVRLLSDAVVRSISHKKNFMQLISGLLMSLNAKLVFDQESGFPSVQFDFKNEQESEYSLEKIFEYLSNEKDKYIIAIDEFQHILNYPEKNVEAVLRTHIQGMSKDVFIFSGSQKHMMISVFSSHSRPFYQSSDVFQLFPIETEVYTDFICQKFSDHSKTIDADMVRHYIEYYHNHTFYVQYFFNRLFEKSGKVVNKKDFEIVNEMILKEREPVFYNYRNLLTEKQFMFLIALAKEGGKEQITSGDFLKKHDLPLPSTVKNITDVLIDKEMVYRDNNVYRVYDVFFEKWMSKTF